MFGWRAKIGNVGGSPRHNTIERDRVLPEGVVWVYSDLGIRKLGPEEFERAFELLPRYAEVMADLVDFLIFSGSAIWHYIGYEKSLERVRRIEETIGIPTIINSTAQINALKKLSAKKIVLVSPFVKERNEERKRFLQDVGFDVLNDKAVGAQTTREIQSLPDYTSYKLARDACREAPKADAILIDCPVWPVLSNIDVLEKDTGKPVVTAVTAEAWAALTALNIKDPIRGYGALLETL